MTGKMRTRKDVLEALGRYQKRGRLVYEVSSMADLLTDESDRGVVVILGSLIEDMLLERLMQSFVHLENAEAKDLNRAGGLLSNFHHRITLAHALGVIDDDMVEMLQTVKAMRNACAHSRLDIGFLTPELRDVLALLFDGDNAEAIRNGSTEVGLRLMFIIAFVYISALLRGDSAEIAAQKSQGIIDTALVEVQVELLKQRALREKRRQQRASHPRQRPTR